MLGLTLTLALLTAAPAKPPPANLPPSVPEDVTLAAPPFDAHKVPKKEVAYFSEHFNQRLAANGIQIISSQQVTSVREMEKLRQLVGCSEASADCIIELGHMLGAQGVLRGTIGKVGDSFLVDVRVYQASDGKVVAAKSASARSGEALVRALDALAVETAEAVKAAFAPAKAPVPPPPPPPPPPDRGPLVVAKPPLPAAPPQKPVDLRGIAWLPAAVGVAAGGASAFFFVQAEGKRTLLRGGEPDFTTAQQARRDGEQSATLGTGLAIGAGAALAGAGVLYLFGKPAGVSVTPAPSGAKLEVKLP